MHDDEVESRASNVKNILFSVTVAFVLYYFFVLPGPSADPVVIDTYNVINQALINSKIFIKDLWVAVQVEHNTVDPIIPVVDPVNVHPSLPGVVIDGISPASSSTVSPNTPRSSGFSHYFREVKTPTVNSSSLPGTVIDGISPASSAASSPSTPKGYNVYFHEDKTPIIASSSLPNVTEVGSSTVLPSINEVNSSTSPILSNIKDNSVQTDIVTGVNKSIQTNILSVTVSKLEETSIIIQNSLPKEDRDALVKMVNENIVNITD